MTRNMNARLAGLVYLMCVLTGIFSLAYVPSQLSLWGDPTIATVAHIIESQFLFRLGILGSIMCYLSFLALPFALYKLLNLRSG
ncbi:DUF4386 family protein [Pseudoalteromonas denitrificans]|uniref:Uncharacterized protein n=1 Tax=Pseudoalteromonas denitrificans DSM 6059 TaxID=1123010 RepID=A0A1I1SVJ1_9GAMM|nr:DUF4386 family protein [Pseudoalteromonas denitrificans]SFD50484.1 protein of unknown function [Pseudoalteromonas denitrificans DSM 6059]